MLKKVPIFKKPWQKDDQFRSIFGTGFSFIPYFRTVFEISFLYFRNSVKFPERKFFPIPFRSIFGIAFSFPVPFRSVFGTARNAHAYYISRSRLQWRFYAAQAQNCTAWAAYILKLQATRASYVILKIELHKTALQSCAAFWSCNYMPT